MCVHAYAYHKLGVHRFLGLHNKLSRGQDIGKATAQTRRNQQQGNSFLLLSFIKNLNPPTYPKEQLETVLQSLAFVPGVRHWAFAGSRHAYGVQ